MVGPWCLCVYYLLSQGEVEQGEGPEEAPTPEPDEDVPTFEEFKQRKLLEQEALQGPADAHTGGHNTRKMKIDKFSF